MAQRALFHSSFFIALLLLLSRCNGHEQQQLPVYKNADAGDCQAINGLQYLHGQPFTGMLYRLYTGSKDTTLLQSFAAGKAHGAWKQFYPGRRLQSIRFFNNGYKTGTYTAWWPNGQQQLEYHFEDDEYEGACSEWNEQGMLVKAMHYHRGHEAGTQQLFYDNGKIRANYIITNGRRYGLLGTKNCINVSEKVFQP